MYFHAPVIAGSGSRNEQLTSCSSSATSALVLVIQKAASRTSSDSAYISTYITASDSSHSSTFCSVRHPACAAPDSAIAVPSSTSGAEPPSIRAKDR